MNNLTEELERQRRIATEAHEKAEQIQALRWSLPVLDDTETIDFPVLTKLADKWHLALYAKAGRQQELFKLLEPELGSGEIKAFGIYRWLEWDVDLHGIKEISIAQWEKKDAI